MKKILNIFLFLGIILNSTTSIFSGLASGTKIITPNGSVFIENLIAGNKVSSYNPENDSFIEVEVEKVRSKKADDAYFIVTNKGIICASGDQLFYENTTNDFIKAEQLKVGNLLQAMNNEECVCLDIVHKNNPTTMYDLILQEPHTYFSSDSNVLTHNMITAFESDLVWIMPVITAIAGYCVAMVCLYNEKPTGTLCKPDKIEEKAYNDMNDFCLKYYYYKKSDFFPENCTQNSSIPNNKKPIKGGIALNFDLVKNMVTYPLRYGSLYPLAFMTNTGSVACVILAPQFSYRGSNGKSYFRIIEFGKEIFPRTHLFVKAFVEAEDKMQLETLLTVIKKWPSALINKLFKSNITLDEKKRLRAQYSNLDQVIYGNTFGIDAIYHMVEKKFSPSLVLQTIRYGNIACNPEKFTYFDPKQDIAVLVEIKSKKIINVGCYKNDINSLNEELGENKESNSSSVPPKDPKDPKNKKDRDGKKDEEQNIEVIKGKGPAPERSKPNSIYEKIDNENPNTVVSRTKYNNNGQTESREDYYKGSKPRMHFDKETKTNLKDHRHIFEYNEKGQLINERVVPLE